LPPPIAAFPFFDWIKITMPALVLFIISMVAYNPYTNESLFILLALYLHWHRHAVQDYIFHYTLLSIQDYNTCNVMSQLLSVICSYILVIKRCVWS
jgi:hypothetical protein